MADEEHDKLCNILPSYSMYNSLYHVAGTSDDEDDTHDFQHPPVYLRESTPAPSRPLSPTIPQTPFEHLVTNTPLMSPMQLRSTSPVRGDGNGDVVANENLSRWQDTILDNVNRLQNLLQSSNPCAKAVDIQVHFTRELCELGKQPTIIDPCQFEYNKGDFLNGFIMITNRGERPIPFDMFYVVFEGLVRVHSREDEKVDTFLTMFDFSASFNSACINRLVTDANNPYLFAYMVDPIDGSHLSFMEDRLIHPGRLYKRFFTFKLPHSLLDTKCMNDIGDHVHLPPTFGNSPLVPMLGNKNGRPVMPRMMSAPHTPKGRPPLIRNASGAVDSAGTQLPSVKDFAGGNVSISYGVLARFIGRKRKYGIPNDLVPHSAKVVNSRGDEYVIFKEQTSYMRVIQRSEALTISNFKIKQAISTQQLNNITSRVNDVVVGLQELDNLGNSSPSLDLLPQVSAELTKLRQLYGAAGVLPAVHRSYQEEVNIVTKLMGFGKKRKPFGTLRVVNPLPMVKIDYIPPPNHRMRDRDTDHDLWQFELPVHLWFLQSGSNRLPEVKDVSVFLKVQTYLTRQYPVSMEFGHPNLVDVQQHARKLTQDLKRAQSTNSAQFSIDKELISDVWGLSELEIKEHDLFLKLPLVKHINSLEWLAASSGQVTPSPGSAEFHKVVKIPIDLTQAQLTPLAVPTNVPSYDRFCLIPSFQLCFVGRYYYLAVVFVVGGESFEVRVPVVVNKPNHETLWQEYKQYLLKQQQT